MGHLNRFGKIPVHQINFSPNCNCLAVVVVELICPAVPLVEYVRASGEPVWANSTRSPPFEPVGIAKLARLKMLKASTLNCALKLSDRAGILVFLNNDMSKFLNPGPISELRPALPRYFPG